MKLKIYEIIEGTDDWPQIDEIECENEKDCYETAEANYGSDGNYHFTNCE